MNWFKETPKTDKELQDEMTAFCKTVIVKNYMSFSDESRYERLLKEFYKRNLKPNMELERQTKKV